MRYIVLAGRVLYTLIFLMSFYKHFTKQTIDYAASQGVPFAEFLVPASGAILVLGALSILIGYQARIGAWLIVLFLVPVTLTMHNFWAVADPAAAAIQRTMFLKNVSMLGAALMLTHLGAGPLSLDARAKGESESRSA